MKKDKELVPRRRFKEFKNDDAWKQEKLGEKVEFFSGLTYSPSDVVYNDGTLVLRSSNVKNGEIVDADNVYVSTEVINSDQVQIGDVIVVVRNGSRHLIGKHAQIKEIMNNTVIGAFMTGIRYKQSSFINALLSTSQFTSEINKNMGATINQITTGAFKEMQFYFTDKEEEKRIGDFFNRLDNLITLQQQKLKKTQDLKSAYLSDLFPKEGEKYPKLRFAGFTEPWEQRKLGEVVAFRQGVQVDLEKQYREKTSTNVRFIRVVDYTQRTKDIRFIDYNSNLNFVEKEDIVMIRYGAAGFVGRGIQGAIANNMFTITPNKKIDKAYLFTFLKMDRIYELLKKNSGSSTMPALKFSVVSDVYITYPKIDEQRKISNFFNKLDKQLTLHQRKLDKLQNLKQAYLNEMFV